MKILSIDITGKQSDLDNIINNESVDSTNKKLTSRQGKSYTVYTFKDGTYDPYEYKLAFEIKNGTELAINDSITLSNFNKSYYLKNYPFQDSDVAINLDTTVRNILHSFAQKSDGTLITMSGNDFTCIKEGKEIPASQMAFKIINRKTKEVIYDSTHKTNYTTTEYSSEDDDEEGYIPKYLLKTWLEDNAQFKEKVSQVPKERSFDMMVQFAMYQKLHGKINATQFRDIVIQAGNFAELVGGFKDNTVKNIYQLIF